MNAPAISDLVGWESAGSKQASWGDEIKDQGTDYIKGQVEDTIKDKIKDGFGINEYFSGDYETELYKYENSFYVGNKQYNKPNGPNLKYRHGDNFGYTLGIFKNGVENGPVIKYDGSEIEIGVQNKGEFEDFSLKTLRNKAYVEIAKYDKDRKKVYGVEYVVFGDLTLVDYKKGVTLGYYDTKTNCWRQKKNDKILKKYKDFKFSDNIVTVNKQNYAIEDRVIYYESGGNEIEYDLKSDHAKLTVQEDHDKEVRFTLNYPFNITVETEDTGSIRTNTVEFNN